jgi:hypothetical protein
MFFGANLFPARLRCDARLQQVVLKMFTRTQRATSIILLAIYLLASATAWLHTRDHQWSECCWPAPASSATDHSSCPFHRIDSQQAPAERCAGLLERSEGERSSDIPRHDRSCTLCRFQLSQKIVSFLPVAVSLSAICPEAITLDVPLQRVAQLPATPDSRAPPIPA